MTTACSNRTTGTVEQTSNSSALTPAADLSVTLISLPGVPSVETSRIVLKTFFDAYNRHDVEEVLLTFSETFAYGDCDFTARQMLVFENKEDITSWLQRKFAEGEQFIAEEMIIAPTEGSPPNEPRSTAVLVNRTNNNFTSVERRSLFKIVFSEEGNRIQFLNAYGNVDCEASR